MQFVRENVAAINIIDGLDARAVRIGDQQISGSLIVMPDHIVTGWPPATPEALRGAHLETVWALQPEIVVLGTGERQRFPPAELLAQGLSRGIGIEVMDTRAACRTYNILALEGRRVAAALILG